VGIKVDSLTIPLIVTETNCKLSVRKGSA